MGWRKLLFGQYQFAVAGDAQTVFFLVMDDHDFVSWTEQHAAAEPSSVVDRAIRRQRVILKRIFSVFHRLRSMVNDGGFAGRALIRQLSRDFLPMFQ